MIQAEVTCHSAHDRSVMPMSPPHPNTLRHGSFFLFLVFLLFVYYSSSATGFSVHSCNHLLGSRSWFLSSCRKSQCPISSDSNGLDKLLRLFVNRFYTISRREASKAEVEKTESKTEQVPLFSLPFAFHKTMTEKSEDHPRSLHI